LSDKSISHEYDEPEMDEIFSQIFSFHLSFQSGFGSTNVIWKSNHEYDEFDHVKSVSFLFGLYEYVENNVLFWINETVTSSQSFVLFGKIELV